ncbi:hypothetical protein Chor_010858 [Crotalus horridus]
MEGGRLSSLQVFAVSSSLHGVSHIFAYGSLSLRRGLWALFFLGSLALLALVCAERVGYFFRYPHVTKLDEVAVANLTFPAVTLCNLNGFRFSKLSRNDLYHAGALLALLDARHEVSGAHLADPETLAALRDKANFRGFKAGPFDMAEFYDRTGHDLAEMLWHCSFRGIDCSARNFSVRSAVAAPSSRKHSQPTVMESPEAEAAPNLVAFAGRCTLHGIRHVFLEGPLTPRRTAWAAAVLAALGIVLYQAAERIQHYAAYSHVMALEEVEGRRLTFPAVTFCNVNRVRRSRLTPSDLHWAGRELLGVELSDHPAYGRALGWPDPEASRAVLSRSFNTREFVERTGHALEDMLLRCRFGNRVCGAGNFSPSYTRLGKCYTFNSGAAGYELLTTVKGGTGNGLELMLNIQQDEYLPVWGDTDETSYEAGVKVQIHSQSEPPSIDQLGFGVAPGFQTFVSCQEQRLFYLPAPWGDCQAAPAASAFFPNYSAAACRLDCETRYLAENCNCRMVHMPEFLVEKDNNFCSCLMPCEAVRYNKELSVVKIPSKASAKYLARKYNRSEQYIAENLLVLDIFFEALNYETIEQKKAYEVAGLLGDIGGQMGLFIGASLLTLLEIFDYLYEASGTGGGAAWPSSRLPNAAGSARAQPAASAKRPLVLRDKLSSYYQGRKEAQHSNSDNLSACHPLRGHSDSIVVSYPTGGLPRHTTLTGFEEFAC